MSTEAIGVANYRCHHLQHQYHVGTSLGISKQSSFNFSNHNNNILNPCHNQLHSASIEENQPRGFLQQQSYNNSSVDDLQRLVNFQQQQASLSLHQQQQNAYHNHMQFSNLQLSAASSSLLSHQEPLSLSMFPSSIQQATGFPERLWDWKTSSTDGSKDFSGGPFK
ncbi:hypothetical protein Leryth_011607 [Lithospermum erythrorhizon]|nr:hypothetical protein Leryth_011607 [Lithospermum erythrorhizon]